SVPVRFGTFGTARTVPLNSNAPILIIVLLFLTDIRRLVDILASRFHRDAIIKIGAFEFKGTVRAVPKVPKRTGTDVIEIDRKIIRAATLEEFEDRAKWRYHGRFIRLVHRVSQNDDPDYPFNVLAYLTVEQIYQQSNQDQDAKPARLNDVDYVE